MGPRAWGRAVGSAVVGVAEAEVKVRLLWCATPRAGAVSLGYRDEGISPGWRHASCLNHDAIHADGARAPAPELTRREGVARLLIPGDSFGFGWDPDDGAPGTRGWRG